MLATIIIALLLLSAVAIFLLAPSLVVDRGTSYEKRLPRAVAVVPVLVALVIGAFACTSIVEARNVGVVTTFGKPVGTEEPGLALKAPWQDVTSIDGTVVTNEYAGDSCVYVRIGDGSRSCVTTTIRWRIIPDKADVIFGDYRRDNEDDPAEAFRKAVISTQFKAAVQEELAKYNPIGELEVVEGSNAEAASELSFAPDYDQISDDLLAQMDDRLGDDPLAEVVDVTVSYVSLSDSTQLTIDDFIKEVGATRNAAQAKNTAREQADANNILSGSVSNNPGVLQARCLDSLATAIEEGYPLPAGFSCFGGSGALVLPAAK